MTALLGALVVRSVAAADAPQGKGVAVVAQGLAAMPSQQLVWRVIRDSALNGTEALVLERALGFAITEQGPIVIEDANAGAVSQVGPGEAAFIPEGAQQRHIGFGEGPSSYVRIGLVDPAEAEFTAGGDLLAVSEVFAAPGGLRDVELSYAEMEEGDDVEIAIAAGPVAVVVLNGSVDAAGIEIIAGDAATLDAGGSLELIGLEDETMVYVAAIGPEIVLGGGPEYVDSGDGTVGLDIFEAGCLNDVQGGLAAHQEQCNLPLTSHTVVVSTDAGEVSTDTFALDGDPRMLAQFTGLPAGAFASIYGADPDNFQFRTMFCGDIATGEFIQPQNSAVQLPNAGGATCFVFYKIISYGDGGIPAPDANPNPNDTAGSGVVDLFEVGCENVQPGLSFQDLRAACATQLPARQVWLGTSAGESIATTAPMGGGLADMRATFDPVRAGSISLFVGGHEGDGWILFATYCGNPSGSGVVPIQNPGYLLADGEYLACFSFFRPS